MLELTDIYKTDRTLKGLETGLSTINMQWYENKKDAIAKGVEQFEHCFRSKGIEVEFTPTNDRYSNKDGQRTEEVDYDGGSYDAIQARIDLGLGNLTYTLKFVKSVDFFNSDWTKVKGTGKITALITTDVYIKSGDRFQEGRFEGSTPLHMNVSNIVNKLNQVTSVITEDDLRSAAYEYLDDVNNSRESFELMCDGLNKLINERKEAISAEMYLLAESKTEELKEAIAASMTRKEFEEKFGDYDFDVRMNDDDEIVRVSERHYSSGSRNEYLSLFNNEEVEAVRVDKPKRKNSKHQDVHKQYKDAEGFTNWWCVEREDFELATRALARHIVAQDWMKREGVFNIVEPKEELV